STPSRRSTTSRAPASTSPPRRTAADTARRTATITATPRIRRTAPVATESRRTIVETSVPASRALPGATGEPNRPGSYGAANRDIIRVLLRPSVAWGIGFLLATLGVALLVYSEYMQLTWGFGMSGANQATFWTTYIVTFVFWVGIGHAGTLISAILFLVRSRW